jgi:CheY-like chemotaxis protein
MKSQNRPTYCPKRLSAIWGEQSASKQNRYTLILMDMQMPVMNGLKATRAIRANSSLNQMPIVAVTANAFAADRVRCLDAGMNDHLGKPIDPAMLYRTVLKWIDGIPAGDVQATSHITPDH